MLPSYGNLLLLGNNYSFPSCLTPPTHMHAQDFETNKELKMNVICFLEEVMHDPELLTQERKAAANIIR